MSTITVMRRYHRQEIIGYASWIAENPQLTNNTRRGRGCLPGMRSSTGYLVNVDTPRAILVAGAGARPRVRHGVRHGVHHGIGASFQARDRLESRAGASAADKTQETAILFLPSNANENVKESQNVKTKISGTSEVTFLKAGHTRLNTLVI